MSVPFRGSSSDLSRKQLRGRSYARLSRDVYVLRGTDLQLRDRVAAAKLVFPDGVCCRQTAALLLRLPVEDDGAIHLTGGPGASRSRRVGLDVHRMQLRADEVLDLDGQLVTTGPRTFADLGPHLVLEALVALGDVVVKRSGQAAVEEAVDRSTGRRGAVLLRQALPLLDPGSDSPAETRARLRLHAAGFTALRHGVIVRDQGGGWLGRPDLADHEARVALQHEGLIHFQKGEHQRRRDVDRDEVMRQQDWEVVISTGIDDARPERLIGKVTAAYLRAARLRGRAVLPPHLR